MWAVHDLLGFVEYHQYWIVPSGDDGPMDFPMGGKPTRLLASTGRSVVVSTGIAMGVIDLTVELLDAEPSSIDAREQWEAVAEVSVNPGESSVGVRLLMSDAPAAFADLDLPDDAEWFRVRAHARGRSINFDLAAGEPDEHHLLQFWPVDHFAEPAELREDDPWERQHRG